MDSRQMIREIHIEGYRSLVDVKLPLRELTVMIGPNGSGKTALLEVLLLLQRASEKQLAAQLSALGGLQAVLSKVRDVEGHLDIKFEADLGLVAQAFASYSFKLTPESVGYSVTSEALHWWSGTERKKQQELDLANKGTNKDGYDHSELALAQIARQTITVLKLHRILSNIESYGALDMGQRATVRLAQSLTPGRRPGADGGDLFSALYNLRTEQAGEYDRILEILRSAFPGFQKLEFPVVGAGQVTLAWHQRGLTTPLYPNQLSEGMLRFLWLVTILLSSDPPSMILMDEPEVSLHPELLMLLAGLLQDAAARAQVVVATHSPDLIRWLEPQQVLVTDKDELGATQFTWADSLNLDEWLKQYTLRDLWLMGTLGGRT